MIYTIKTAVKPEGELKTFIDYEIENTVLTINTIDLNETINYSKNLIEQHQQIIGAIKFSGVFTDRDDNKIKEDICDQMSGDVCFEGFTVHKKITKALKKLLDDYKVEKLIIKEGDYFAGVSLSSNYIKRLSYIIQIDCIDEIIEAVKNAETVKAVEIQFDEEKYKNNKIENETLIFNFKKKASQSIKITSKKVMLLKEKPSKQEAPPSPYLFFSEKPQKIKKAKTETEYNGEFIEKYRQELELAIVTGKSHLLESLEQHLEHNFPDLVIFKLDELIRHRNIINNLVLPVKKNEELKNVMKDTDYYLLNWSLKNNNTLLLNYLFDRLSSRTLFIGLSQNDFAVYKDFLKGYSGTQEAKGILQRILNKLSEKADVNDILEAFAKDNPLLENYIPKTNISFGKSV